MPQHAIRTNVNRITGLARQPWSIIENSFIDI